MQHLSVATFFVFILSLISPWFGFQSLGYRLLPGILDQLGIPPPYHWSGGAVIVIAMCYLCSNGMLAFFGGHKEGFVLFEKRQQNTIGGNSDGSA